MNHNEKIQAFRIALRIGGLDFGEQDIIIILAMNDLIEQKKGQATVDDILRVFKDAAKEAKQ
jgi:hypothetical protein